MGCECTRDTNNIDNTNDIVIKIEKRLLNMNEDRKEKKQLLSSERQDLNSDYYTFSKELMKNINNFRTNPFLFIEYLNTNFSSKIIPNNPPIEIKDLFGVQRKIEVTEFIELFNNINTNNSIKLNNIEWNEDLYNICHNYLGLVNKIGYIGAKSMTNLNKNISELFKGKFKCYEIIISGLYDMNMCIIMILLDGVFFKKLKEDIFCGAVCSLNKDAQFTFMVLLVKKVGEKEENLVELNLGDPILNYIGFKEEINKAYVIKKEENNVLMKFFMKDGSIIEEFVHY